MKLLNGNLKQKESEVSKVGGFKANKRWLDNFRKRFGFKKISRQQEKKLLLTKRQQILCKTFIGEEEKGTSRCKAGKESYTILFCASTITVKIDTKSTD